MLPLTLNKVYPVSRFQNAKPTLDSILILLFLIHFSLFCSLFFILLKFSAFHPILQFSGSLGTETAHFMECWMKLLVSPKLCSLIIFNSTHIETSPPHHDLCTLLPRRVVKTGSMPAQPPTSLVSPSLKWGS